MSCLLKIALLCPLLLVLPGCRTLGGMLEGQNSDQQHGGGYCPVPKHDADGEVYVPRRDWSAGPERVW